MGGRETNNGKWKLLDTQYREGSGLFLMKKGAVSKGGKQKKGCNLSARGQRGENNYLISLTGRAEETAGIIHVVLKGRKGELGITRKLSLREGEVKVFSNHSRNP